MYVSVNKQLMGSQSCFAVLFRLRQRYFLISDLSAGNITRIRGQQAAPSGSCTVCTAADALRRHTIPVIKPCSCVHVQYDTFSHSDASFLRIVVGRKR